jgi:hypothetical protein
LFNNRRALYIPYVILAFILIAYSAFWFYGKSKAEEKIAALFEARGDIACDNHAISGFPFSYILTCDKARFMRGEDKFEAVQIKAIVKPWNPRHVIAEVTTPLVITPKGKDQMTINAETMSISASENAEKQRRVSVVMRKGAISGVNFQEGELHLQNQGMFFKQSLALTDVKHALGTLKTFNNDFSGTINRDNRTMKIDELNLKADDVRVKTSGDFNLTSDNRPDGKAKIAFMGLEPLFAKAGINPGTLKTGMALFGRKTTIDGVEAQEITLDIKNGRVMLGPIAVYTLPPLY